MMDKTPPTALSRWLQTTPTVTVAQRLLGATLQVETCAGLIVETEAYLGAKDQAAHAFNHHQTPRNQVLWAPGGVLYVYQMRQYCLLNLVTQGAGVPECVLIRAIEPTAGRATMATRRQKSGVDLTNGPGKLTQALALTLADNATPVGARVQLRLDGASPKAILRTPRIGVPNKGAATTALLRFTVAGNAYVSRQLKRAVDPQGGWHNGNTQHVRLYRPEAGHPGF